MRDGFTIPMPKPGDGTKLIANRDGSLTCSWDRPPAPRMALDADPFNGGSDPEGPDLEDKVRELLNGKLDDADISALLELIMGPGPQAPQLQPAQDRRRALAHDELQYRVSTSLARRAQVTNAGLIARFPALKNARVI